MDSMEGVLVKKQNVAADRDEDGSYKTNERQRDTEIKRRGSYESFWLW